MNCCLDKLAWFRSWLGGYTAGIFGWCQCCCFESNSTVESPDTWMKTHQFSLFFFTSEPSSTVGFCRLELSRAEKLQDGHVGWKKSPKPPPTLGNCGNFELIIPPVSIGRAGYLASALWAKVWGRNHEKTKVLLFPNNKIPQNKQNTIT